MIDLSHANSSEGLQEVRLDGGQRQSAGQVGGRFEHRIIGVMVESHLVEGKPGHSSPGKSADLTGRASPIACLGWDDSVALLDTLAESVKARRRGRPAKAKR